MSNVSNTLADSAERRAFRHYLRTGQRLPHGLFADDDGAAVELKYNHWHDELGRFTYAGGGTHDGNPSGGGASSRRGAGHRVGAIQTGTGSAKPTGKVQRPSDNVVPGPLPTYRDRADIHERVARDINRLATTLNSSANIQLGGHDFKIKRLQDNSVELEARPYLIFHIEIGGRMHIKSGVNALKISDLNIKQNIGKILSHPKNLIIFRDSSSRLFINLDRKMKVEGRVRSVDIPPGSHPISEKMICL